MRPIDGPSSPSPVIKNEIDPLGFPFVSRCRATAARKQGDAALHDRAAAVAYGRQRSAR